MSSVSRAAARMTFLVEGASLAPIASESPQVFVMFKKQTKKGTLSLWFKHEDEVSRREWAGCGF